MEALPPHKSRGTGRLSRHWMTMLEVTDIIAIAEMAPGPLMKRKDSRCDPYLRNGRSGGGVAAYVLKGLQSGEVTDVYLFRTGVSMRVVAPRAAGRRLRRRYAGGSGSCGKPPGTRMGRRPASLIPPPTGGPTGGRPSPAGEPSSEAPSVLQPPVQWPWQDTAPWSPGPGDPPPSWADSFGQRGAGGLCSWPGRTPPAPPGFPPPLRR